MESYPEVNSIINKIKVVTAKGESFIMEGEFKVLKILSALSGPSYYVKVSWFPSKNHEDIMWGYYYPEF